MCALAGFAGRSLWGAPVEFMIRLVAEQATVDPSQPPNDRLQERCRSMDDQLGRVHLSAREATPRERRADLMPTGSQGRPSHPRGGRPDAAAR
jgi:hypothetical protein